MKSRNFSAVFAIAERSQIRTRPHLRAVQLSLSAISQQDTASSTKAYTRQLTCHTPNVTMTLSRHCSFTPINRFDLLLLCYTLWVARYSSRVVSVLDSGAEGPGFKSINQSIKVFYSGLSNLNHCEVHYSARRKDCCSRNVFK